MGAKQTLLIIEDDDAVVHNLTEALGDGYTVTRLTTGEKAATEAEVLMPDVIVLDFDLPHKHGDEVLVELKANKKTAGIPVLVLTNMSDPISISKILAAGGREYLVKTDWRLDQVVEKIKQMM